MGIEKITIKRGLAWGAVPEALITDPRLGHAAARLGCWLATRPNNWDVDKKHAKRVCRLGESLWDKACKELRSAGYIVTTQVRESGKFRGLNWAFNPVPNATGGGFSAPGETGHSSTALGSAEDGEPAHLTTTHKTKQVKQKQPQHSLKPPAAAMVVSEIEQNPSNPALQGSEGPQSDDLIYPACLNAEQRNAAKGLLAGLGRVEAQVVLDEVEGGARRWAIKNPLGLIRHLAGLAAGGNLVAELAGDVRATRQARAAHIARMSAEQPQTVLRQAGEPQTQLGPEAALARERARAQIEEMRKSKS